MKRATPNSQLPNHEFDGKSPLLAKPYDLRERSFLFALRILKVAASLPKTPETIIVRRQLTRSGTSIGANIEEADGAVSRADKRRSLIIARKEARETAYWLRIAKHLMSGSTAMDADVQEAAELASILSVIVSKLGQTD